MVTVHPRVCGEQEPVRVVDLAGDGSSPRVRGTEAGEFLRQRAQRFIPACAGNRARVARASTAEAVHPRVCGEQFLVWSITTHLSGSSPRVRGTG